MRDLAHITVRLRNLGYQMTEGRLELLRLVFATRRPFAPEEIHTALSRQGLRIDFGALSRELMTLKSLSVLRSVSVGDGTRRFTCIHHGPQRMFCDACRRRLDIHVISIASHAHCPSCLQ